VGRVVDAVFMRTHLLIAAAAVAIVVALLVVAAASLGGTPQGETLLTIIAVVGVGPVVLLLWAGGYGLRFAHARDRTALRLRQEIDRCHRGRERIVLALLRFPAPTLRDIPFFRAHRHVLNGLRSRFRSYDQVERIGFSTYAMIMPDSAEIGAKNVRERLHDLLRREHRWNATVGISIHPEDGLTPAILLDHAERHCA
jgi:hypothetical protein